MTKNLREYTKNTTTRLVIGFLILVFLVGDGLIFLLYGKEAGFFGLVCLAAALVPVFLIVLLLGVAEKYVSKNNES